MKNTFVFLMTLVIYWASLGHSEVQRESKIAIASQGKTEEALVAQKAARAPYYLLFGETGELLEVLANPHKDVSRRAGSGAAQFLAENEVTLVVAGVFGNNMLDALRSKAIRRMEFTGKVGEAIKKALDSEKSKRD